MPDDHFVIPARERDALNGRRLLLLGLKLTVSVLLIWYLLGTHDLGAVGRHLGDVSARSVSLALIVLSASVILVSLPQESRSGEYLQRLRRDRG